MPPARNHEELKAWTLCWQLKERVFDFTAKGPASGDSKFCNQIRSASCSACDRLAEGFYRYYTREFARFCSMTLGSLGEIKSQLCHAREREYINDAQYAEIWDLASQASAATTGLLKYLLRCPARGGLQDTRKRRLRTEN
jgi:four helix bundle protein